MKPLLLFVLGLCACSLSCVSPGAKPMADSFSAAPKLPEQGDSEQPLKVRKRGIPSSLPQTAEPPLLRWDSFSRAITWNYEHLGDYNQDGEPNVADITQIANYFGASQPFNENGLPVVVDGDQNGEVNLADITPIAVNYLNPAGTYKLYSSADEADVPAEPDAPDGAGTQLVDEFSLADANVITGRRKFFSHVASADTDGMYYWVRAVIDDVEGLASNAVLVMAGAVADLTAQPTSGTAPLRVTFDGSQSHGGAEAITAYLWDFDGDGVIDLDSGSLSVVDHVYTDQGNYVARLTVTTLSSTSTSSNQPISVSPSGFEFTVWDETFIGGGAAGGFNFIENDLGDTIEVEIYSDNAIALKALFGALSYDQGSFRFVECTPGVSLGVQGELLSFNMVSPESRVHIGQCMALPQDKVGLFGDHLLATAVFSKEPEPAVETRREVPLDAVSAVPDLSASRLDGTLVWRYNNSGDFNQDGAVHASDLAVLAYYWGRVGPFNHSSTLLLADANADNLISDGDIDSLPGSYLQGVSGFNAYGSDNASDYPLDAAAPNGPGAIVLGYLPLSAGVGDVLEERLRFSLQAAGGELPDYLWVRPVLDGLEGISSNLVEPSTEFFISPDWSDVDWDEVTGSGASTFNPLRLGATGDGRTFSFIASTLPDGQGAMIDVATLTWEITPQDSGTMPEIAVLVPRSPIAIGFVEATDSLGNSSNQLFFFAGTTPGG